MASTYLELVENFLNTELQVGFDSGALDATRKISEDQLQMFQQHWSLVDRTQHETLVKVQPFVSATSGAAPSGVNKQGMPLPDERPTSVLFTHPYNGLAKIDLDLIKRQALFFSRVAVIAPVTPRSYELAEAREEFKSFLQNMIDLKPLVEDGTVELVPMAGFYSNEIEGGAAIVRNACQEDPKIKSWIEKRATSCADFSKTARPGDPYFDAGIRICSALAYGHSFAATHPFVGGLFKELLSDAPKMDKSKVTATQHLSKIDLPGFSNLSWADIKSVRENEESLIRWRADLRDAISSVDPDVEPEIFIERFDSQVQARLSKAAIDLNRELADSSAMAKFRKGSTELGISAVAAATMGLVFGPAAAAWQAVVEIFRKDGPREALRFMWESKERKGQHALRSHYAVFSGR